MGRTTSDLPFGSEFSPSQVELSVILELIRTHEGDARALENSIRVRYFCSHADGREDEEGIYNRAKLANNCKLGLIAYGIINREGKFTPFGEELWNHRGDEKTLYQLLARHILLNLNGMNLIQCIQDMTVAGETVNLTSLRECLGERGVKYPPGGKHPSIMRLWLAKAGVILQRSKVP